MWDIKMKATNKQDKQTLTDREQQRDGGWGEVEKGKEMHVYGERRLDGHTMQYTDDV